ncbi:MAG: hypothetical protein RLZZ371_2708 [Pseudomonadota bacterium]
MVYRKNPQALDALRQLAKARLSQRRGAMDAALDVQQVQHLLEELEIHQIELEMQNEHLSTARMQLEQALSQSNGLFDFAPVSSMVINTDGNIVRLNLASARLLGSERARLVGSRLGLYVIKDQRAQFSVMLKRARDELEVQDAELAFQIDEAEPIPAQVRVNWLGDDSGWQIAVFDLSEQRRMKDQLRSSEERLRLALEAVGDCVWDWDVRSNLMRLSDGYTRLFGYSSGELRQDVDWLLRLVHPDDKPPLMDALNGCLSGSHESFNLEHRIQCRDDSWKWVLGRGTVVTRSANGEALRMVGTMVDVSQRKKFESDLLESLEFQHAMFDSISAQIAVLSHEGVIQLTNVAWRNFFSSLGLEVPVGNNYQDVLNGLFPTDSAAVSDLVAGMTLVAEGKIPYFHSMEPINTRCGSRWITVKITLVHGPSRRLVVTHEDVSVLKRAELASLALANVDDLTGALSRQYFMSQAEQEMARSLRYALPLVLLMLDLDHFKNVNDSYGHPAGEEFAVLLPNTTQEGGCALANRILAAVRASPVMFEEQRIAYTVSIGASYLAKQTSFNLLLAESDAALYRAKKGGRDRLEVNWGDSDQSQDKAPLYLGF